MGISEVNRKARERAIRKRFYAKFAELHPRLRLMSKCKNMSSPIKVECLDCGEKFVKPAKWYTTNRKTGCNTCAWRRGSSVTAKLKHSRYRKHFLSEIAKSHPHIKVLDPESVEGRMGKIRVKCLDCGRKWKPYASVLLSSKHGCRACTNRKVMKELGDAKTERSQKRALAKPGFSITFPSPHRVHYICKECGYSGKTSLGCFLAAQRGCKGCAVRNGPYNGHSSYHEVRVGGRLFQVMGYEPHALRYLVRDKGVRARRIQVKSLPRFEYFDKDGCKRQYIPDILVDTDKIVEVKSVATLGCVKGYPAKLSVVKKKRQAVLDAGYRFTLMVFNGRGERLPLPKKWHTYTTNQLISHFDQFPNK